MADRREEGNREQRRGRTETLFGLWAADNSEPWHINRTLIRDRRVPTWHSNERTSFYPAARCSVTLPRNLLDSYNSPINLRVALAGRAPVCVRARVHKIDPCGVIGYTRRPLQLCAIRRGISAVIRHQSRRRISRAVPIFAPREGRPNQIRFANPPLSGAEPHEAAPRAANSLRDRSNLSRIGSHPVDPSR